MFFLAKVSRLKMKQEMKQNKLIEIRKLRYTLLFIIIIVVIVRGIISISDREQKQKQFMEHFAYISSLKKISQPSVCSIDGKSVKKQDESSLFIVPKDMKRIYICGYLETPNSDLITIYLYKSGSDRAFYVETSGTLLQTGPFIIELISTDDLKGGEYRADLSVVKEIRATVQFLYQK